MITFDQAITGTSHPDELGDPFDNCVVYCGYDVFATQGFTFLPVLGAGGDEGEGIVVHPEVLPEVVDNGTDYLLAGGIVTMKRTDGADFSLVSVDASMITDDTDVAQFLRLFAFKAGAPFQLLTFDLALGFQTIVLPSTWTGLSQVNISGRLAASGPDGAFPRLVAVDNIVVPEPTSLLLLGTALVLFARARRR